MGGSSGAMGSSGNSGTSQDTGKGGLASAVTSAVNPQELHKTIDKAAQAAQPVMDRLATSAHAGVDKVTNMLSGASVSMGQRQQQLTDASQKLMDSTREYVREKPGTAIAIAAAAGFILAKLLGGSNRRDY
jgi:ElaB/YqjD/DUF883 family membrane-anchored ribosome-binding protein